MITHALALSLLVQTSQDQLDYSIPAGASVEFTRLVTRIEGLMSESKFAEAEALSKLLPHSEISVKVNSSKLDDVQGREFFNAVRSAATLWERKLIKAAAFEFVTSGKADIVLSYEPVLAKVAGSDQVAGSALFFATEPKQPYLEAVFGLKRGPNLEALRGVEVFNESLFTFGRYLGLIPNPVFGTAMGRVDGQMAMATSISGRESIAARRVLTLSHLIREAIHAKKKISSGSPTLSLGQKSLKFDAQFQGDPGVAKLVVTNTGTSPLELSVQGDCGCITGQVESPLQPGGSTLVTGVFDTTEIIGDVHHNLILTTNDAEHPTTIIPVNILVKSRADFIFPISNTVYFDGPSRDFTFYVNVAEEPRFNILKSAVTGADLPLKIDPFEGDVPNFMTPGQKQHISGYRITVDTSTYPVAGLFGRTMGMVYLRTDSKKIPVARSNIYFQKGIACLPESVFFGSPTGPDTTSFVLTRPGRPFKVKKVSSEAKYLSFQVTPDAVLKDTQYFVKVDYNGKALGHRFKADILVETDDPKQPIIHVPIQTSSI